MLCQSIFLASLVLSSGLYRAKQPSRSPMHTYLVRPRSSRSAMKNSFVVVARSMADLALQIDKHADPHRYEAVLLEEGDLFSLDGDAVPFDDEDRAWAPVKFGPLESRYRPKTSEELALEDVSYHLAQAHKHISLSACRAEDLENITHAARAYVAYAGLAGVLVGARRAAAWRFKDCHLVMHAAQIRGLLDKDAPKLTAMQVLASLIAEGAAADQEHTDLAAFSQARSTEAV